MVRYTLLRLWPSACPRPSLVTDNSLYVGYPHDWVAFCVSERMTRGAAPSVGDSSPKSFARSIG
jgi:hypothetical protein